VDKYYSEFQATGKVAVKVVQQERLGQAKMIIEAMTDSEHKYFLYVMMQAFNKIVENLSGGVAIQKESFTGIEAAQYNESIEDFYDRGGPVDYSHFN